MPRSISSAALVSFVDPYPADSGKPVVLDGFLQFLTDRLGADNVHYLLIGGRVRRTDDAFPVTLHELPGPSARDRLLGIVTHGVTGRASLQEALLRSPSVGRAVRDRLAELGVDLAVYDTLRCGQHAGVDAKVHQVCYLEDLHSQRYRLMLETMRRFPDVDMQALGTFAEQVPAAIRPLAQSRRGQRVLLSIEYRLSRRSEVRAARRFASNLLVNEDEAALLRSRAGVPADRVHAVPPVVREPRDVERTWDGAPEFVFLGMLTQAHNEDGIRNFLVHTWPELLRHRPDAVLRLIGRPPRAAIREIAARHGDSVVLEGFVPDLDRLLARAAAMMNPLRFGSGVKIKVIEALGRGLPVVSSRVGADGIESGPDSGILIGDGVTDTVEAMLTLVDPAQNRAASAAAKAHFQRRYGRSAAFACYDRAFGLVP